MIRIDILKDQFSNHKKHKDGKQYSYSALK